MRFVLNTKFLQTAASLVCIKKLSNLLISNGYEATINDWNNYDKYDVVIFMTYDSEIYKARIQNKNIKVGLADPKHNAYDKAEKADFLLVSSIEQRECFYKYNKNIFIYYMVPEFDSYQVVHKDKEKIIIGYHGNVIHLNSFYQEITPALEELGKKYDIELHAIYNIKQLGLWKLGRPNATLCKVVDLQWYENCYKDYFKNIDIGITPSLYPGKYKNFIKKFLSTSKYLFIENHSDYLIKYKFSTNAGRIFVFGNFNIPVISDAVPSSGDLIKDKESGRLVLSKYGWYYALEELILSSDKRDKYSNNLFTNININYNNQKIFEDFICFLNNSNFTQSTIELKEKKPFLLSYILSSYYKRIIKKLNIKLNNEI